MRPRRCSFWAAALALASFGACSNGDNYPLAVNTSAIVIIDTPFTYTAGYDSTGTPITVQIAADWFKTSFTFVDNGPDPVTITAISVIVNLPTDPNNPSTSSTIQTSECDITNTGGTTGPPLTLDNPRAGPTSPDTSYLLAVYPNGQINHTLDGTTSQTQFTSVTLKNVYCSGLTFPTGTTNYSTQAQIIPKGWRGTPTNPTARLQVNNITVQTN